MLMKDIQVEQGILEQKLFALISKLSYNQFTIMHLKQFRKSDCEYLNLQELTLFILNKLIAKIEIEIIEVVESERQQKVRIELRFAE